jgi:hypothetical protein
MDQRVQQHNQRQKKPRQDAGVFYWNMALLHKDLKCKAPLIEPNLRRNLGKWST